MRRPFFSAFISGKWVPDSLEKAFVIQKTIRNRLNGLDDIVDPFDYPRVHVLCRMGDDSEPVRSEVLGNPNQGADSASDGQLSPLICSRFGGQRIAGVLSQHRSRWYCMMYAAAVGSLDYNRSLNCTSSSKRVIFLRFRASTHSAPLLRTCFGFSGRAVFAAWTHTRSMYFDKQSTRSRHRHLRRLL